MARKSFKDNPAAAAMFISEPQQPAQQINATVTPPPGYKLNPQFVETKSKRVQLLMQPSLHARLKEAAAAQGISLNDYIHRALEKAVEQE